MSEVLDKSTGNEHQSFNFEERINDRIENGYSFDLGKYISIAFDIFKKNPGIFIAFMFVHGLIFIAASFVPFGNLVLAPPLSVAYAIVAQRIHKGDTYQFENFFDGFKFMGQLLLGGIVMSIFIFLGFIALIIPGIFLAVAYSMTSYIIWFNKMEFWPAMEYSRKLVTRKWFSFLAFYIVLFFINVLGFLLLGIGLLVTIPVTSIAAYVAYEEIIGTNQAQ